MDHPFHRIILYHTPLQHTTSTSVRSTPCLMTTPRLAQQNTYFDICQIIAYSSAFLATMPFLLPAFATMSGHTGVNLATKLWWAVMRDYERSLASRLTRSNPRDREISVAHRSSDTRPSSVRWSLMRHVLVRYAPALIDGKASTAIAPFGQEAWPSLGLRAIVIVGTPAMGVN